MGLVEPIQWLRVMALHEPYSPTSVDRTIQGCELSGVADKVDNHIFTSGVRLPASEGQS
jgi:hypothetical protein